MAARNAAERLQASIARAEEHLAACERDVESANVAIEAARDADVTAIAASLQNADGAVNAPTAARKARALALERDDARDIAAAALAKLHTAKTEMEEDLCLKATAVQAAMAAAVANTATRLLHEVIELKAKAAVAHAIAAELLGNSEINKPSGLSDTAELHARSEREASLAAAKALLQRAGLSGFDIAGAERVSTALGQWREALAALRHDATAALPLPPA